MNISFKNYIESLLNFQIATYEEITKKLSFDLYFVSNEECFHIICSNCFLFF